jgi:MoCo/4Fe-4S cofactor protein with predicted Tat translocation signal
MASNKIYWKNIDQLDSDNNDVKKLEDNEFVSKIPVDDFIEDSNSIKDSSASRRDFLKYIGFSTAAATLAACEGPVIKSVPYVIQPEQIRPGIANYYATSIADGFDFANILVKTREGRPIKVESNLDAPFFGSANARVNASVLSMYDSLRIQGPKANGSEVSWEDFYSQVGTILNQFSSLNKKVVLLTQTFASPTTTNIINDFIKTYPNVKHVVYDSVSSDSALNAFESYYGIRALADYDFSKANTIVSFDADFLGDWQGGGYDSGYAKMRTPNGHKGSSEMSWHIQFESNMSLTGANADKRIAVKPVQLKNILLRLYSELTNKKLKTENLAVDYKNEINDCLNRIKNAGSGAVIVSGIEDDLIQKLILNINTFINSDAFNIKSPRLIREGNNSDVQNFLNEISSGEVEGFISMGVNPVYSLPEGKAFAEAIKKLDFSLVFSSKEDETASVAKYIAAIPHQLESWGDYQMKYGHYSLAQPTIRPLFDTKQFQDVLLSLSGKSTDYYESIKAYWNKSILKDASWSKSLHDGYFSIKSNFKYSSIPEIDISNYLEEKDNSLSLVLYTKTGMGDGQQANNPWLQEFPDPLTRVSWDNYLTVSMSDAKSLNLKNRNTSNGALNGSYAKVTVENKSLVIPVLIQPGQAKGTVGLAFGYGDRKGFKKEMQVGVNAFNLFKNFKKTQSVSVLPIEGEHEFACVQLHNTLMGRGDIIKETSLEVFNTKNKNFWNSVPKVSKNHIEVEVSSPEVDMYQEFDRSIGHHFNLSIDLNSCTGCGACVIACHAENNVPVVGKTEVRKSRDMHWLRIDRYYSSENSFDSDNNTKDSISGLSDSLTKLRKMEIASENPQVAFQPVMCQHCNHAPCETVCPVAATSHGRQGQNHMAYNRCVGTRYCANNCPYKVRRFNWFLYNKNDEFDYHMNNDLGRMVLNPDVVVRSRGVMEKCSFCIQMTQKTILDAKLDGREIKDGEFATACSKACGSGAMVFGDINDKESKVSKLKENDRMYHLLESVGTKPNVMYQLKVRNSDKI